MTPDSFNPTLNSWTQWRTKNRKPFFFYLSLQWKEFLSSCNSRPLCFRLEPLDEEVVKKLARRKKQQLEQMIVEVMQHERVYETWIISDPSSMPFKLPPPRYVTHTTAVNHKRQPKLSKLHRNMQSFDEPITNQYTFSLPSQHLQTSRPFPQFFWNIFGILSSFFLLLFFLVLIVPLSLCRISSFHYPPSFCLSIKLSHYSHFILAVAKQRQRHFFFPLSFHHGLSAFYFLFDFLSPVISNFNSRV